MTIETSRLSLREVSGADAGFIFALMNEPAYLQHIGDRGVRTPEDASAYIRDKFTASYARFGYGLLLAELRGSRQPVGICGFVRRETLEHPDVGFAFRREYWGRGLAHEAAAAVLHDGFSRLGLTTILGVTSPANESSIRLLKKLGLRYQRMLRVPPREDESMIFSIDAPRRPYPAALRQ